MSRSLLIDSTKALASQLIVLHHLALYSPMADTLALAWPRLLAFIEVHGRLAVQPFLVMGGFLAARSLQSMGRHCLPQLILQRYLRLAPPLAMALVLVVGVSWWLGPHLAGQDWVSPLPTWQALLAHLLLLQDVLEIPALSAGVWYVAIDFQLYALLAALAWACGRAGRPLAESAAPVLVALGAAASVLVFNRDPDWDDWAPYFLSAYGLGVLAAWAQVSQRARRCALALVLLILLEWMAQPRERPLLALGTAAALYTASHLRWPAHAPGAALLGMLSRLSYGVFVAHFAAIVLVSGLWLQWGGEGLGAALVAAALTCLLGLGLGALIEAASARLAARW